MANDQAHHGEMRTSLSHPLRIATLSIGANGGAVGVTFAPGKRQISAMTGSWDRNLDLAAIREWGASDLITLLEPHEFAELSIEDLPKRAGAHGLRWHGLPITDGAAPDARFLLPWETLFPSLLGSVMAGGRVVVHCKGGLGRAGTVACLFLLSSGAAIDAKGAIALVRHVRPDAVETIHQEDFIAQWPRNQHSLQQPLSRT